MPATREDSRPLGVVYTPPEVYGPMVRLMLEPLVDGKSAAEILAVRVLDPAIGTGAFLLAVIEVLAAKLLAAWHRDDRDAPPDPDSWPKQATRQIAATCVAGVDVDREAVEAVRDALAVLDGDQEACPGLRIADALELDWEAAYPEVFARGGFDVVVGNPPYIRQEWLGGKPALKKFTSYDGVADLYVYFVELAHRVLRPNGRFCLIVPNKWLTAAYGRPLRTYLAAKESVDGIVDFSRAPLFADADAFPCIVWGTAGLRKRTAIVAVRADGDEPVDVVLARAARGVAGIERERWGADPWHIDLPSERALLDRLERMYPPLGEVVRERPSRGVVTGCNRAFVIDRATRDRIVAEEPAAAALLRPFLKGRDVKRWLPEHAERWIVLVDRGTPLDALPVVRAHLAQFREALEPRPATWTGAWTGRKPGAYAWHELQDPVGPLVKARTPRLLYQDIQTAPACAIDRDGALVPDTTVWMLPTEDLFLLALLNSPLYAWYARRRFPPALNGAVRPKLEYMRRLPIALPSPAVRATIVELVQRRLDPEAARVGPELDGAIASAVFDAYAISTAERRMIATA